VDLLKLAYNNIKSKPGNITPGITPETLDGISLEKLENLSLLLKSENFQFSPGRRIEVPKPSGGNRPLTIANPIDKLIQEGIRIIRPPWAMRFMNLYFSITLMVFGRVEAVTPL